MGEEEADRRRRELTLDVGAKKAGLNSAICRSGIVTLSGYGIKAFVSRGHLVLEEGIGSNRREAHFARVGHGIRRVVVIGADGIVSLAALQWLSDQDAAFVMLERDGRVLA